MSGHAEEGKKMNELAKFEIELTPPRITVDFASMHKQLANYLEPYDGLSEESVRNLSDGVLRDCNHELKVYIDDIDTARKATKKEYNRDLNDFEAGCKELLAKVNEPKQIIANEIKRRQQAKRDVRYDALKQVYEEAAEALTHSVSFEKIIEPKWLNISTPYNKAESELLEKVQRIIHGWNALHATELKFPGETERIYFETLDLQKALEHDAAAFAAQQRIDATKAEVAENKAANGLPDEAEWSPAYVLAIEIPDRTCARELTTFLEERGLRWKLLSGSIPTLAEAVTQFGGAVE